MSTKITNFSVHNSKAASQRSLHAAHVHDGLFIFDPGCMAVCSVPRMSHLYTTCINSTATYSYLQMTCHAYRFLEEFVPTCTLKIFEMGCQRKCYLRISKI